MSALLTDLHQSCSDFEFWQHYDGLLSEVFEKHPLTGEPMRTRLFGFERLTDRQQTNFSVPAKGSVFGFVIEGSAVVKLSGQSRAYASIEQGQWFSLSNGIDLSLAVGTRVLAIQSMGFYGLNATGGPIEPAGRLRYIDRCSDTLLAPPPLLGDPCLNHLHFPDWIEQTQHTHPTGRFGAVVRGSGYCETPSGRYDLLPGLIFHIPAEGRHRFVTLEQSMDVIAFHPDSDWGPTDQNHPMIKRTLVEGEKLNNSNARHDGPQILGWVATH